MLYYPAGVAVDAQGDLFIADSGNNVVREVIPGPGGLSDGTIITVAGDGTAGYSGDGGAATEAMLNNPDALAVDANGDLFIADYNNAAVRQVVPGPEGFSDGTISTFAGNRSFGYSGDGGPATSAMLGQPNGLAVDAHGDLLISDAADDVVRMVDPQGTITTVAGGLNHPAGLAVDSSGDLFIADQSNNVIGELKLGPDGQLPSFVGSITVVAGGGGLELSGPNGVAVNAEGDLFIADEGNNVVHEVTPNGTVSTVVGNGTAGYSGDGGPANAAELNFPQVLALDSNGDLFIADVGNNVIREVTPGPDGLSDGTITTVAGDGTAGYSGDGGPATDAMLNYPNGIAVDAAGDLFIADSNNHVVREVIPGPDGLSDGTITTVAGDGSAGYSGDGGPATAAMLNNPNAVAVDASGDLFIADYNSAVVREVKPGPNGLSDGTITKFAGNGSFGYSGDGGPATSAMLGRPNGLTVDAHGDLLISDAADDVVRMVDPQGTITTVVGGLNYPAGLAIDSSGDLFIADQNNNVIRELKPGADGQFSSLGTTTTVAGGGQELVNATGVAVNAQGDLFVSDQIDGLVQEVTPSGVITTVASGLDQPSGLAIGPNGDLFIAETGSNVVLELTPGTGGRFSDGTITTVAGDGTAGYSGDGGPATSAALNLPSGLALDAQGDLFIADSGNQAIREVTPGPDGQLSDGTITTVARNPVSDFSFYVNETAVAIDSQGDLIVADTSDGFGFVWEETPGPDGLLTDGAVHFVSGLPLDAPSGLVVNAQGDLMVDNVGGDQILEVGPAGIVTVAASFPAGVVADQGYFFNLNGSGPIYTQGLAIDSQGNLFFPQSAAADGVSLGGVAFVGAPSLTVLAAAVNNFATTTTISTSSQASVAGQAVTFTATVTSPGPNSGLPTGTVSFMDGNTVLDTEALGGGTASFTTSTLAVGPHTITAVYSGDSNFMAGTSAALTQQVNNLLPSNLQTVVAAQESSGGTVTLAAATPSALTSVLAAIASLQPSSAGAVSVELGNTAVYAEYDGAGNIIPIAASAPEGVTLTISCPTGSATVYDLQYSGGNVIVQGTPGQGSITIIGESPALTVSAGNVTIGPGVTLITATNSPTILVTGGSLTLRGAVVQESTSYTQAALVITGGTVDLGTAASPGGNIFNVNGTGQFIEDTTVSPVPDIGNTLEVDGAPVAAPFLSLTSLASSATTAVLGQSVTFTAPVQAVNPTDGTPTGTVEFVDTTTGTELGTAAVTNGSAILTTSALVAGSQTITAEYDGDTNFAFGFATLTETVQPGVATTTTLSSSAGSSLYGQAVTFTSTVTGNSPASGTPTGTVTFYDGAINVADQIGTGTLSTSSSGVTTATFSTQSLPAGTYAVTVVYGGSSSYPASTSNTLSETIAPAPLMITAINQTKVYGQANPALTVSYSGFVNGDTSASFTTQPSVAANANTSSPVGTYTITASGAVDSDYTISYVAGTLTVTPAALTITANNQLKVYGQANPALTYTYTGLVNGDASAAFSGSLSTTATSSSGVGSYPIAQGSLAATGNYSIGTFDAGTLTVTWTTNGSIFVLDPSAGGALTLSGNASVSVAGSVSVDSSSSSALSASGNAAIKASFVDVHGGVQKSGNASFSPAPVTGAAAVADPLVSLPLPGAPTLTKYGSESVSGNSVVTIGPGIYSQISVSGNGQLTMTAGTYIVQGGGFTASGNGVVKLGAGSYILEGGGLSVSGNAAISGTGVTIFNVGSSYNPSTGTDGGSFGGVTLSGNGTVSLTPPGSGTYAGILIDQARDNNKALTFSGNAMQGVTGTIYAPAAQLAESGNAQIGSSSNPVSIIVDTLTLSGNGIANTVTLSSPSGTVAYTPNQIRDAYGINALGLDGTGQTIAIVDAYDDPDIFQAVDAFDSQFTLTDSGPSLYPQYGPASSFLTVLNQYGQATSLPSTDPNGPGTDNWEVEEALDVEWTHAVAPGAQIILVEANSQSLSDLMASVATAAAQPGVSVVSMSWGFAEGQAVFASDEAMYDSFFDVPGVTFVASTGDYAAADPEYPAFSPNVVAVGGTSLMLNADNSYNSETGWGYYSSSAGALIGSGGGISLYEPEPAFQQGMQSTGYRTTPDVSLVADPATGVWIADPYNLDPNNPFEIVGGTSVSAPAWAGLFALVNQGSAAAGGSALNSSSPTETQQALYSLPQNDYNAITSGSNGYTAGAGYNLVTGLGTPVANLLVSDMVAYQTGTFVASGPTVGPLQNANLVDTGTGSSSPMDVFSVFDSLTAAGDGLSQGRGSRLAGVPVVRWVPGSTGSVEIAMKSPRALDAEMGRSFAERTTTLPPGQFEANAAVDEVLGSLQTDSDTGGSLIDELAVDLVSPQMRRTHGGRAMK
jgi:Bacterial Ig-like domain (group 3)/MBG domain (YGX type)/NHL repeat